jgi:hypothetical protein
MTRAESLQEAALNWLTPQFDDTESIALTLTFKRRVGATWLSEEIAQSTLRHFLQRINKVERKKRRLSGSDRLRVVAIREGAVAKGQKHLHYHLQIQVPTGTDAEHFSAHCRQVWSRLDWGAVQTDAKYVRDSGWMSYMLKLRDKSDFAYAIDIDNCWLGQWH